MGQEGKGFDKGHFDSFQAEEWLVGPNEGWLAKAGVPLRPGLPQQLRPCQTVATSSTSCGPQRASGKLRLLTT